MRTEPYIVRNVSGIIIEWVMDITEDIEIKIKRDYSGRHNDYRYSWTMEPTKGFAIPANIPSTKTESLNIALQEIKEYFALKSRYYTPERESGFLEVLQKFPIE
jgi:hypothetical protein